MKIRTVNYWGKRLFLGLFLLTTFNSTEAQYTKHQVGINASKFIVLFNEQVNNLDLSYRYRIDSLYSLRSALNLDITSAEEGISDMAFRLGLDRYFLLKKNWKYYLGVEANYMSNNLKSSKRTNSNYGLFAFIGFLYNIGESFSISTEPTLALYRFKVSDEDDFSPNANRSWTEMKILNIGQVKISFHF